MPHRLLPRRGHTWMALLPCLVVLFGLTGCGEEGPFEITDVRKVEKIPAHQRTRRSSEQRFFAGGPSNPVAPVKPTYTWAKPEGWTEVPVKPMQMRDASFSAPGGVDVSLLVGRRSDILANVNRWRGQMGADPVGPEAIQGLRFGPGYRVDLEGTFATPTGPKSEQRFIGFLFAAPDHLLSARMLGPKASVDAQAGAFEAFVRSLEPQGAAPPARPPGPGPSGDSDSDLRQGLAWETPAGWRSERHDSGMRIASFKIDGAPKVDVPLIVMAGGADRLEANLGLWAGSVGRQPLTTDDVDALERFALLDGEAVFVELEGSRNVEGEGTVDMVLLGVVCMLDDRSLYLRFVGRASDVLPHRAAFLALARSLRMGE